MHKRRVAGAILLMFLARALSALASDQNTLLIAPGDLLHIRVADTPEMDEDARVTDQGMVPVVGIGDVKVAGLTPSDAAAVVHDKLIDGHYLNHPQVSIIVKEFATQQVSVIGEVKTSGSYPIATPRPILAVLALAGGLNPEANRRWRRSSARRDRVLALLPRHAQFSKMPGSEFARVYTCVWACFRHPYRDEEWHMPKAVEPTALAVHSGEFSILTAQRNDRNRLGEQTGPACRLESTK